MLHRIARFFVARTLRSFWPEPCPNAPARCEVFWIPGLSVWAYFFEGEFCVLAPLPLGKIFAPRKSATRRGAPIAKLCSCGSLLNLSAAELRSPPSISRSLRSISFGVFWIAVTRSKFGQSVSIFSLHSLIASCVWTDERPSCRPSSRLFSRPSQRCVVLVLARASASRLRHYYYLLSASDACAAPLTARLSSSPSPPPSARSVWPPWRGSSSLFSSRASRARAAAAAAARLLEPLLFSFSAADAALWRARLCASPAA